MNQNGFNVNTNIGMKPQKRKPKRKTVKSIFKNGIVLGIAVLVVLALIALAFCKFVPVYKVTIAEKCVINFANGDRQINYYDLDERIVKKEYYYEGELIGYTVCTYDNKGNILKEESTYQNVLSDITEYIYTGDRLTRKEIKNPEGAIINAVNYYYNADSTLTMELCYNEEGNMIMQENYTYEGGVVTGKSSFNITTNRMESTSYTYSGEKLASMTVASFDSKTTTTYTYDSRGNVLTENSSKNGIAVYEYTYKTIKVSVFDRRR